MKINRTIGTGGLVMMLVVALAALGIGIALWSKVITISGTVQTGRVHASIERAFTDDDDAVDVPALDSQDTGACRDIGGVDDATPFENKDRTDGLTTCDPAETGRDPKPHYDKDVARCDADVDEQDNNRATISKRNVYPSYHCTAWLLVHNDGTIPVKIVRARAVVTCPNGDVFPVDLTPSVPTDLNLDCLDGPDASVHLTGITRCQQIDPSQRFFMDIDQHILQTAPQGAELKYAIEVLLAQWNEADQFDCPPPAAGCQGAAGAVDVCIDADGSASAGHGIPAFAEVQPGDPLSAFPDSHPTFDAGLDWHDQDGDEVFTPGANDDLMLEGDACLPGSRDGDFDDNALAKDCKVLDLNGDLVDGDLVDCDLTLPFNFSIAAPGVCPDPDVKWHDTNGNGAYNNGEDIVFDTNGNGIFD